MGLDRDPIRYFRGAFTGADKLAFDAVTQRAEHHEEIVILGVDRMEVLFLSVLLEHEKEILKLRIKFQDRS